MSFSYRGFQLGGAPKAPDLSPTGYIKTGPVTNPWQSNFLQMYQKMGQNPYSSQWGSAVNQAMALGNKDYTGDLRRFAAQDLAQQYKGYAGQLSAMNMKELALNKDQQNDWAQRRQDAFTKASMSGQQMQQQALDSMRSMLSSASGANLDQLIAQLQSAIAGGGNYNQFAQMLIPLLMAKGANGGGGGGSARQ